MLDHGSSATCQYEFIDAGHGLLRLPDLMFTAYGETVHRAVLELADASQKPVRITMGPRVGEATFSVAE